MVCYYFTCELKTCSETQHVQVQHLTLELPPLSECEVALQCFLMATSHACCCAKLLM